MKAISPMIAAVLMIAFVISAGAVISIWFGSLLTVQTTSVGTAGRKAAQCAASTLVITETRYNRSSPPASRSQYVNVTVSYKSGTEPLRNLTVEVSGGGVTNSSDETISAGVITKNPRYVSSDFRPGMSEGFSVNITQGALMPPDLVTARVACATDYIVSTECRRGQSCMIQEAT